MQYQYATLNYPTDAELNDYGKEGWKIYHVRPDSGNVPWFVYLMREVQVSTTPYTFPLVTTVPCVVNS